MTSSATASTDATTMTNASTRRARKLSAKRRSEADIDAHVAAGGNGYRNRLAATLRLPGGELVGPRRDAFEREAAIRLHYRVKAVFHDDDAGAHPLVNLAIHA